MPSGELSGIGGFDSDRRLHSRSTSSDSDPQLQTRNRDNRKRLSANQHIANRVEASA